jgi:predicted Fe-Mo cluster-binding NifX family protein
MLIAVSADGALLSSAVSENFESCRFLQLIETDDMTVDALETTGNAAELTDLIIERDCEAIITGKLSVDIFNSIAGVGITRYSGFGCSVGEALQLMDRNKLEYIRYADENDTCHGDHSGVDCDCGEDD